MKGRRRLQGRRRLKRSAKPIRASFDAGHLRAVGYVSSLSRKGLFFSTETLPRPGDAVAVAFRGGHGENILVRGTVRWTTAQLRRLASGFGMQIDEAPDEYRELYERLLTS